MALAKYLWNVVNSYLALLAVLHVVLWLCFYPRCVALIKTLQLLPWAATSVQDEKLLSIVEYVTICAVTPIVALLAVHGIKSAVPWFNKVSSVYLGLLTLLSSGSLLLSHQAGKNMWLVMLLLLMTLLCLALDLYSVKLMSRFSLLIRS